MANINAIYQMRQDTAANMASVVLRSGEPGYTTDTKLLKIGDGVNTFANISQITDTMSAQFNNLTGRCSVLILYTASTHLPNTNFYIDTAPRGP